MGNPTENSSVVVSERLVSDGYPELFHYTNWKGLEGIFQSGRLWATRYDCLNDSSEVYELKKHLEAAFHDSIRQHALDFRKQNLNERRNIKKLGGIEKVVERQSQSLIAEFYRTTFQGDEDAPAFAEPFIFSFFCQHGGRSTYESGHGLLSQWRAYGSAYAIVFDTKALEGPVSDQSLRYFQSIDARAAYSDEKLKIDHFRDLEVTQRPYIELFDAFPGRPKIKRVIVGPGANQTQNAARAQGLLKNAVPVVCSDTPFIG